MPLFLIFIIFNRHLRRTIIHSPFAEAGRLFYVHSWWPGLNMNLCALPIIIIFVLCQVSDRAHLVFDFHQAVDGLQVVLHYICF
jgi:hypothetical protein